MTTLHDRLADLADEAPTPVPDPGLWDRGRRYHRRRRAGTLAVAAAAVVLLALLGGTTWHRAAPPLQPATGPVGLPDRVWEPSPWLPAADRPGQLVALTMAERGAWTGIRGGLVGISATTGEYAFLDLPDAAPDGADAPTLSPDGRHVAYWLTGGTTGTPNTGSGPVTGLAVYDTETGDVSRHWIRTPHGLSADFLSWVDADTLAFSAGQREGGDDASATDQSTSRFATVMSWSMGREPEPVPGVAPGAYLIGAAHGRILVDTRSSGSEYRLIDLADPSAGRVVDVPGVSGSVNGLHFVALDASGRRVALVVGSRTPNRVHAGVVGDLREVPNTRGTSGVLDWLHSDTIVTLRHARDRADEESGLYRVSLSTGESRELVRFPRLNYGGGWQFATDLLDAPSVHAGAPPRPLDPRWMTGLAVATALAAAGGVVLWRRRVRP